MTHDLSKEDIRIGTLIKAERAPQAIRDLAGMGFESYSLTFWRTLGEINLERLAGEVKEALGDSGIIISSVGVFGNPLEKETVDRETREGWERLIDHAHLFGTDIVAGFTGRLRGRPVEESLPRFEEVFGDLAARAEHKGVRLAFENCSMGGNWQSGDWNLAFNPRAWEMLFDAVPSNNIGLEWEPCHQLVQFIDPMPQIREWADRIFHVHGKDATIRWDLIRRNGILNEDDGTYHRTPGFGDSNWTEIISDLRRIGFRGAIDIEGWHDPVYRSDLEMTGQVAGLKHLKQCRGGHFVATPDSMR